MRTILLLISWKWISHTFSTTSSFSKVTKPKPGRHTYRLFFQHLTSLIVTSPEEVMFLPCLIVCRFGLSAGSHKNYWTDFREHWTEDGSQSRPLSFWCRLGWRDRESVRWYCMDLDLKKKKKSYEVACIFKRVQCEANKGHCWPLAFIRIQGNCSAECQFSYVLRYRSVKKTCSSRQLHWKKKKKVVKKTEFSVLVFSKTCSRLNIPETLKNRSPTSGYNTTNTSHF